MDAPGATEASQSRVEPGQGSPARPSTHHRRPHRQLHTETGDDDGEEQEDPNREREESATETMSYYGEEEEDDDEEEEEPHLKYSHLTKQLGSAYRNGDATSTFLAAGDKMVCILSPLTLQKADRIIGAWHT